MKVVIGKYVRYFGIYQLTDLLQYVGVPEDKCFELGEYLEDSKLSKFLNWCQSKKTRKEYVKLDRWDVWSMDNTLAMIILPLLLQLKQQKCGAPLVKDEDVPDELKSSTSVENPSSHGTDTNYFKRWDYAIDEMIWAFTQLNIDGHDSEFFTHKPSVKGESIESMIAGTTFDRVGYEIHDNRINNGLILFGKYFRGLWT